MEMVKYKIEYYTFDNDNGKIVIKETNVFDNITSYARWMTLFDKYPSKFRYIRTIKINEV